MAAGYQRSHVEDGPAPGSVRPRRRVCPAGCHCRGCRGPRRGDRRSPEYWRFDRSGGGYYGEPLAGERLVDGIYQPVPLSGEPDGILKGYSPALRLSLCWDNEMLRFYNPESGDYLRSFEAEQARADSEQAARQAEQAARERAEARVRELEEELERRDRES